ncbi:MAG: hypothetical protein JNK12_14480 [Acidimicrobiales bacterium]|nr:hypothetical protein [Acidimicrobiales bacterium]
MNLEISNLMGLPAHPLIVHGVVVLVPLAALGLLLSAVWPAARDKIGWITVGISALCLVMIPFATGSGENLEERVDETRLVEEHAELAERMLPWVILLFAAALLVMLFFHYRDKVHAKVADGSLSEAPGWMKIASPLLIAFAIIASLGNVWTTYEVGHSGAKATWDDTPTEEHEGGEEHESEEEEEGLPALEAGTLTLT